ncbi:hypothetical protein RFI_28730 [Reticulomyxa filosa]|uniref:Alpha-ketoglutarate-dependent dioxygenase AlkB-like domain-containing protein n=1 Tax=Reticulomyxa filosa TaxID=46433 RepID=X6M5B2_RETFI|nr:hypothetical protein RFI_28730 [Reticulomyxa filosa]|eukprot:ETO08657.1 hypothetical protein RFI_28730 [Reticulomyxa filosa]
MSVESRKDDISIETLTKPTFVLNHNGLNVDCYVLSPEHYIYCIHNWIDYKEGQSVRKTLRKIAEPDLMRHGNRRHTLYFDAMETKDLTKHYYRYGNKDWPMIQNIPAEFKAIKDNITQKLNIDLNGIVYNVYTSKHSCIWWHTDLQEGIGDCVCTLTFGRTGYLQFRKMNSPLPYRPKSTHPQELPTLPLERMAMATDASESKKSTVDKDILSQDEASLKQEQHDTNTKAKKSIKKKDALKGDMTARAAVTGTVITTVIMQMQMKSQIQVKVNVHVTMVMMVLLTVPCRHGTLCIMGPGINEHFQHRINVPSRQELDAALQEFQSIDRENLTFHFHFDTDVTQTVKNWDTSYSIFEDHNSQSTPKFQDLLNASKESYSRLFKNSVQTKAL